MSRFDRIYHRVSIAGFLFLALIPSACVRITPPSTVSVFTKETPLARAAALRQVSAWQVQGVLSVQNGQNLHILSYHWQQEGPTHFTLRLSSSLNVVSFVIQGREGRVELIKDQHVQVAKTPQQLLQQQIGLRLPIEHLYYWIRGMAAQGSRINHVLYDQFGHISQLQQDGWNVQYISYQKSGAVDLPNFLRLTNATLQIKIVIKKWISHS